MSKKTKVHQFNPKRKDRKVKDFTMEDFMLEKEVDHQIPIIGGNNIGYVDPGRIAEEKYLENVNEYNKNIHNYDPLYEQVVPMRKLLVRIHASQPEVSKNGIIIPNRPKVPVRTKNGQGIKDMVESPYPFAETAVVIAVPEIYQMTYKVGDIIHLDQIPLIAPTPGDPTVVPRFYYMHPSHQLKMIPTQVTDRHFGYFLLPLEVIDAKINNYEVDTSEINETGVEETSEL